MYSHYMVLHYAYIDSSKYIELLNIKERRKSNINNQNKNYLYPIIEICIYN